MILSILNQKGGTSKTTVAVNLAVMYARDGGKVLLVDADSQGSAKAWASIRPDRLAKIGTVEITTPDIGREIERLRKEHDVIIIDGGGRVTATARACVLASDFILIPTMVSTPDVLATQHFFDEVIINAAKIKAVAGAIVCTMVKLGTVFNTSGQEQIKKLGYPVLDVVICHRIVYQEAFSEGKGVIEYEPDGKATEEIKQLYREIKKAQKT
jgi:chromosome partitioning protein